MGKRYLMSYPPGVATIIDEIYDEVVDGRVESRISKHMTRFALSACVFAGIPFKSTKSSAVTLADEWYKVLSVKYTPSKCILVELAKKLIQSDVLHDFVDDVLSLDPELTPFTIEVSARLNTVCVITE